LFTIILYPICTPIPRSLKLLTIDVIKILERHGYVVRHKSEAKSSISFSRMIPAATQHFKDEALERIRQQLTSNHLEFETIKVADLQDSQTRMSQLGCG
jgi:hypothetical protein